MKRAGKVFLALTLVLAMLWTSTGTSNVPGVLAENVASMQSAKDNKEAVKATTEETTTETTEKVRQLRKRSRRRLLKGRDDNAGSCDRSGNEERRSGYSGKESRIYNGCEEKDSKE